MKILQNLLIDCIVRLSKPGLLGPLQLPVAEAAKIIENTQRDVNIALINELAMIPIN